MEKENILDKLAELHPAETELLINRKDTDLQMLLKLTFCNLLLNKVLILKKKQRRPHPNDRLREYVVVETGENFASYDGNASESIFINIVDNDSYYYIIPYLKSVYRSAFSKNNYIKLILKNKSINVFYKSNFLRKILNLYSLSTKGRELKNEILKCLDELNNSFNHDLKSNHEKTIEIIKKIKGNIFLIKNLEITSLKKINVIEEYLKVNTQQTFFLDVFTNASFEILLETFDSLETFFDYSFYIPSSGYEPNFDFGDF